MSVCSLAKVELINEACPFCGSFQVGNLTGEETCYHCGSILGPRMEVRWEQRDIVNCYDKRIRVPSNFKQHYPKEINDYQNLFFWSTSATYSGISVRTRSRADYLFAKASKTPVFERWQAEVTSKRAHTCRFSRLYFLAIEMASREYKETLPEIWQKQARISVETRRKIMPAFLPHMNKRRLIGVCKNYRNLAIKKIWEEYQLTGIGYGLVSKYARIFNSTYSKVHYYLHLYHPEFNGNRPKLGEKNVVNQKRNV